MAGPGQGLGLGGDRGVADRVGDVLAGGRFEIEFDVGDQRLAAAIFVIVNPDLDREGQGAHEYLQNLDAHGPITSGVRQARCWPPSTAIIWPVTEVASIR